jgi:DNA-binding NarL/FixJ family response regulator
VVAVQQGVVIRARAVAAVRTTTVVQHEDQFIRSGLAHVLGLEPDIEVVGQAATPSELISACADTRPDAVLLEIDAAGWDALRLAAALRKRQRTLRFVGLYEALAPDAARRAFQAGVRTIVSYDAGARSVVSAVRGAPRPAAAPVMRMPAVRHALQLTPREIDIVRLIAAGKLTREIGAELGITMKTVENHKQRIFRKLDVQNQAHAVSIAIRRGLLAPSAVAHRG